MTPAQHGAEAERLLTETASPVVTSSNARLAQAHALLSTKTGKGDGYQAATSALEAAAATSPETQPRDFDTHLHTALARAHMAS